MGISAVAKTSPLENGIFAVGKWKTPEPDASSGGRASIASTTGSETKLIRAVHSIYRRWAYFVVDYSTQIIVVCSIITVLCTIKIAVTPQVNDITGYTPYGARSRDELAVRSEFFDQDGLGVGLMLLMLPKQGNNMLVDDYLKEVTEIDDFVMNNISIYNDVKQQNETFSQYCKNFCKVNEPIINFYKGFHHQSELVAAGEQLSSRIQLNYPVTFIYGRRLNIQQNLFGITFRNETKENDISNMESAEMVALLYKGERVKGWTDQRIKDYEMRISHYFENEFVSRNLRVMTISTTYVETEVVRAGMSMIPFLVIGFGIMAVCSTLTVLLSATYMQQVSIHKVSLAVTACICPMMACGTALGLLFMMGVRFGSILCVTPFLVLAIGCDDAYLMIHAWQLVSKRMQKNPDKEDSVAYRLSLVLIDTGPAILISALTNILADAVGSVTGSPEITLLCIGNMAAIFVDFIYQITFYSAIMAIAAKYEMRKEALQRYNLSITIGDPEFAKNTKQIVSFEPSTQFHDNVKDKFHKFMSGYVDFITNTVTATAIFALWIAFIAVSLVGITRFEVNLTTKKLYPQDSPLLEIDHLRETQIVPYYHVATIFVNNPGNLSEPLRRRQLFQFVDELEAIPESWGPQSTNFFLRDFLAYEAVTREPTDDEDSVDPNGLGGHELITAKDLARFDKNVNFDVEEIVSFLNWPEYDFWQGFVKYNKDENNRTVLNSFFFTTAYHGEILKKWATRSKMLQKWRSIVDSYPQFNATVFQEEGVFLDLIDNMPTDTWQSALATMACMAAVCFVFMYNTFTVLVASGVIASIITGMLGTLSWQGVTMDPIMMAALIISIGFSIDIPAHVSYHYHSAGYENPGASVKERLKYTFASVGFPAIQASLSTNLCVLSMLFVDLYMSQVFVRIMCLCIGLSLVHSLVVLPAIFSLIERLSRVLRRRKEPKVVIVGNR